MGHCMLCAALKSPNTEQYTRAFNIPFTVLMQYFVYVYGIRKMPHKLTFGAFFCSTLYTFSSRICPLQHPRLVSFKAS